jgi:hypothetical protein
VAHIGGERFATGTDEVCLEIDDIWGSQNSVSEACECQWLRRGCATVRRIRDDALWRRTPTVVDFDGAWLGGNAGVRVMNLAVKIEN